MKTQMKLTPKTSQKMQVKTTLLYSGLGIVITSIIGMLCFFYLNMGNSDDVMANTVYSSGTSGAWTMNSTWTGARPALNVTNKETVNINLGHEVVVETNLNFDQNSTLRINGTLVIKGNLTMLQGTNLLVGPGAILIVMGDYIAAHQQEFVNRGDIVILGNITTAHQSTYTNTGSIYADATLPITSGSAVQPESNIQNNTYLYNLLQTHGYSASNLPVTLISFSVEDATDRVNVYWSTANEKNNDFFSIERSTDGKIFEVIGKVAGNGNSFDVLKYSFTDHEPLNGRTFYRLKQTDFDGEFEYFDIAAITRKSAAAVFSLISVGPNPFNDEFTINFNAEADGMVEIQLINSKGEQVASERFNANAGLNQYKFTDGYKLTKDIYFLRVMQNGRATNTLRLIKR